MQGSLISTVFLDDNDDDDYDDENEWFHGMVDRKKCNQPYLHPG